MGCCQSSSSNVPVDASGPRDPAPPTAEPDAGVVAEGCHVNTVIASNLEAIAESRDDAIFVENDAPLVATSEADEGVAQHTSVEIEAAQKEEAAERRLSEVNAEASADAERVVEVARSGCREAIGRGDIFGAERRLSEAVRALGAGGEGCEFRTTALERLRTSEEYRKALGQIISYEQAVARVLDSSDDGDESWTLAAEVPVEYKSLEVELSPECNAALPKESRVIRVYWRLTEGRLEIRIAAVLPTMPANTTDSTLVGWVAMNLETDLYHTWHPVVYGNGPAVVEKWSTHHSLCRVMLKILWLKMVQLQEQYVFHNFESGAHVLLIEDLPLEHDMWQKHPAPDKFQANPDPATMSVVLLPQELTSFVGVHLVSVMHTPPPSMILKLLVSWVFPEVVRRVLRAGARCLAGSGPHASLIQQDATGLYGEARRLVIRARELDAARKTAVSFTPNCLPSVRDVIVRSWSLRDFEAEVLLIGWEAARKLGAEAVGREDALHVPRPSLEARPSHRRSAAGEDSETPPERLCSVASDVGTERPPHPPDGDKLFSPKAVPPLRL